MYEKVKKNFTILFPFTFFHSSKSIILNCIELITQIIIISIYSTQKSRRNHLLIQYLSGKRDYLLSSPQFLIFCIFFSKYLSISPIKFSQRITFLSININCDLKIFIKSIKIRVTRKLKKKLKKIYIEISCGLMD